MYLEGELSKLDSFLGAAHIIDQNPVVRCNCYARREEVSFLHNLMVMGLGGGCEMAADLAIRQLWFLGMPLYKRIVKTGERCLWSQYACEAIRKEKLKMAGVIVKKNDLTLNACSS